MTSLVTRRLFVCAVALLCASSLFAQTPVKRVLVEEFTGAWCPWCIDGPVKLAAIHEKYGDQVIVSAVHDNDDMQTTEYSDADGLKIMAPFFPSGCINRRFYSDESSKKVGIDRENWEKRVAEELAKPAIVDVQIKNMKFDNLKNQISVTVEATFAEDATGDMRFNLMFTEDGITGTGSGYDQANAYNTLSGQESHPWFGKGSPIKGYVHNHVFRKAVDGAWGISGDIPASVKKGDHFTKEYTFTIPAEWDNDKLSVIAVVQRYDSDVNSREILNAMEMEMSTGPTKILSTGGISIVPSGQSYNYSFTVANRSGNTQTYMVDAKKTARTPANWSVAMNGNTEITVPAGSTQIVTVTMNVGSTVGIGDIEASVTVKDNSSEKYYARMMSILHNGVSSLELLSDNATYSLGNNSYLSIDLASSPGVMNKLMTLPNLKTIVYNTGEQGNIAAEDAAIMSDLFDKGVSMLFAGTGFAKNAKNNASSLMTMLNMQYSGESKVGRTGSNNVAFSVESVANNPVASGVKIDNCMLVQGLTEVLALSGSAKAFLKHSGSGEIIGAYVQLSNARAVIMPNPAIFGAGKDDLMTKVLAWLDANKPTPQAIMRVSQNLLLYGDVGVGYTKSMNIPIRSTGSLPLKITGITWSNPEVDTKVFSLPITLPFTIASGENYRFDINYTPNETGNNTTSCTITTNASNAPTHTVLIRANGIVSVAEPYRSEDGSISLQAQPNPASDEIRLRYTLTSPEQVTIVVVDMMGRQVLRVANPTVNAGENIMPLSVAGLAAGNYRVVMNSATAITYVPLVIVR